MKHFNAGRFLSELEAKIRNITENLRNAVNPITKHSIDRIFSDFHSMFFDLVNAHAPWKTASQKQKNGKFSRKPWITRKILKLSRIKDSIYVKSLKDKDSGLYNNYKRLRNKITHITKLSRKKYIDNRIKNAKNKSKMM